MIKPVFYIIIFLSIVFFGKAQENLVSNGSFESLYSCPVGADIEKAIGWFSPSDGTPDLFNSCADPFLNISVPVNGLGTQHAFDGNGYAGFVTYGQGTNYREYIATRLINTLRTGSFYQITFYVNLPENSPLAANNLGFGFLKDSLYFPIASIIEVDYFSSSDYIVMDSINWVKLSFIYEANGTENYIVIGNFKSDSETSSISIKNSGADQYYFIDNVSVVEIVREVENVFTPNGDGVNDFAFKYTDFSWGEIMIFNRWGNLVNETNFSIGWNGTDKDNKPLSEGVYFYIILSDTKRQIKTGFIHLVR